MNPEKTEISVKVKVNIEVFEKDDFLSYAVNIRRRGVNDRIVVDGFSSERDLKKHAKAKIASIAREKFI